MAISTPLVRELQIARSSRREVIRSADEIDGWPNAHALRKAWGKIGLSAIFCVDGKPTVYLKEVQQIRANDVRRYQSLAWNQGIATLLAVCSPREIHVYSALVPPPSADEDSAAKPRLVQVLDRTADTMDVQLLIRRVESGQIYRDNPDSFDRESSVDRYLLRNLKAVASRLRAIDSTVSYSTIHGLLTRTIFTCYLTDRRVIGEEAFRNAGAAGIASLRELFEQYELQASLEVMCDLFEDLQQQFNGSMFDEESGDETRSIAPGHIDLLRQFFSGDDLENQQRSLGFWAYDFEFIPIETISAIYEEFLGLRESELKKSASSSKRKRGAYYTPKHLAELVVEMATESWSSPLEKRCLDPACGSGIFLVTLFNRMAQEWCRKNPGKRAPTRWRALREILENQLFGVDKDETACRIACFSLYLALLDQFNPRDICEFAGKGRLLPNLLLKPGDSLPPDEHRTILCRNFFNDDLPLPGKTFDLVIGNPPWVGRNQPKDPKAESWYKKFVKQKLPGGQVAHAFMWKASTHTVARGQCCLLLPSKVLLNRTDDFQKKWFHEHQVDQVLQLADLRRILFENAICPAIIVRYAAAGGGDNERGFDYVTPQASRFDPRRGVIVIAPEDRKSISFSEFAYFADQEELPKLWKMHLRATPRDIRFLERLSTFPCLGDIAAKARSRTGKRWIIGQGFQPGADKHGTNQPWWRSDHLFIDARSREIDLVLEESACEPMRNKFRKLRRLPPKAVFQGPMVLVNQGFSNFAYADFDVLFRHSLQSISGPRADEDYLIFLCMVLRSRLTRYFMFHTAANWGMERDKVHEHELLRLPFPLPERMPDPPAARRLIKRVANSFRKAAAALRKSSNFLDREGIIDRTDKAVLPLVYEYYGIDTWESMLIDDTCDVVEPSATPPSLVSDIIALRMATTQDREAYTDSICEVLNDWASRSGWVVSGGSVASSRTGLGVITLKKSSASRDALHTEADNELEKTLDRIRDLLPTRSSRRTFLRGLKIFDDDSIHIVKPLVRRYWTQTTALNDADELVTAILSSGKET